MLRPLQPRVPRVGRQSTPPVGRGYLAAHRDTLGLRLTGRDDCAVALDASVNCLVYDRIRQHLLGLCTAPGTRHDRGLAVPNGTA